MTSGSVRTSPLPERAPVRSDPVPPSPEPAEGDGRRGPLLVMFALYAALLVWAVVWKLEIPYIGAGEPRAIKLVPFVQTREAGASQALEVLANLLLFVPFGAYLGLLRPRRPTGSLAMAAGASLAMEAAQFALAVGMPDVTDVIVNTAGGAAGLILIALVRLALRGRTFAVMTRAAAAVTVCAMLATAAYLASPLHIRQADVRVDAWNSHDPGPDPSPSGR